ncbi:hypothetical protein Cadr_000005713 [Camelus dromedarius]|uniref:Uncharacterized protein n=1 Tax=Camelus dromedarius TaxID=9838 RepID=A0A5N4E206_CAMDR|nr:hypothetical protein Cadr_000005713 [Camelus dromedarius]
MRLVTGVAVLLTWGTVIEAEIDQPKSKDFAEGEDVNRLQPLYRRWNDYIRGIGKAQSESSISFMAFETCDQQHGLSDQATDESPAAGPAPGRPERQRCVLLRLERHSGDGAALCSISLVARRGGTGRLQPLRANLEPPRRRLREQSEGVRGRKE